MLERWGIKLNAKKLDRLYKEERLTVRKRGGRKRALGARAPMTVPQDRNLRWSLDYVADTLVNGRRFRIRPHLNSVRVEIRDTALRSKSSVMDFPQSLL
jgi:hypothetical protein